MTEVEWLACEDARAMLPALHDKASTRKVRLFCCACCRRRGADLAASEAAGRAVAVVERFVEGGATTEELEGACDAAMTATYAKAVERLSAFQVDTTEERRIAMTARIARWAARELTPETRMRAAEVAVSVDCWEEAGLSSREAALAPLVREIFGGPPRPPGVEPSWLTPAVRSLAPLAYGERELPSGHLDNARLAVLSDALEEAGCTDEAILSHLRSPGPHVRGCWALDLILGKG